MIYHQEDDVTLHQGDAATVLATLPDRSINACVTSPPYFNLRDYGIDGQIGLEASPDEFVTDSLDRNVNANRSNSEGYERSDEFVGNEAAPGGTSRIWWYRA